MDEKTMVTIAVFLLIQTGGLVWFLATMKSQIEYLKDEVTRLRHDLGQSLDTPIKRLDKVEDRLNAIERQCLVHHGRTIHSAE